MTLLKTISLFIFGCGLFFLNLSCDKTTKINENASQEISSNAFKVSPKDIEQIKYTAFALSNLSEKTTRNWLKFVEFQKQIDVLKKGDLAFFKDDNPVLKSFLTDLKNEIPETLNIPSILVRLVVLETTIFKLEGVANLNSINKELLLKAIKDVLVANSNIIFQMNKKFEKEAQKIQKPI